jgi:hypothetical protein
MRNLLRNRRGSVALATVIALVPLIGAMAFGAEAVTWYVTKQKAQNAADAAAYSGAITLATCEFGGGAACPISETYASRGEQFAIQNGFCNVGTSASTCPTNSAIVQTVAIERGTLAGTVFSVDGGGGHIRATVAQEQPAYLAGVLGFSTINIGAVAIAQVQNPKDVCALGIGPGDPGLTIGGSSQITGSGCALMSNNSVKFNSEPTFVGTGWSVNAVNGCTGGHCDNYTNVLPATNPLEKLDSKSYNSRTGNTNPLGPSSCPPTLPTDVPSGTNKCYTITPNSSGSGAYKDLSVQTKEWVNFSPGTYFFYNATIKVTGGYISCTACTSASGVTLILLGTSSFDITGGTVVLNAGTTNSFDADLNGVLIDDQSSKSVKMNGGSTSLGGVMYFPNADVSWSGSTQNANSSCTGVIAATLTITGNSYLSSSGCGSTTIPKTQVVALVQ